MGKKTKRKTKRKTKTRKQSTKINTLLGVGKDGCIIESISCEEYSKKNGYVAKVLFHGKSMIPELHSTLEELDPKNERFNRYYFPNQENCIKDKNYASDIEKCSKQGLLEGEPQILFQKKLDPLLSLTRQQYRFLRDSLQILHDHNISHGDLPDNIMIHPVTKMPIIIDWEEAKVNADTIDKEIDRTAFLYHFKVAKN